MSQKIFLRICWFGLGLIFCSCSSPKQTASQRWDLHKLTAINGFAECYYWQSGKFPMNRSDIQSLMNRSLPTVVIPSSDLIEFHVRRLIGNRFEVLFEIQTRDGTMKRNWGTTRQYWTKQDSYKPILIFIGYEKTGQVKFDLFEDAQNVANYIAENFADNLPRRSAMPQKGSFGLYMRHDGIRNYAQIRQQFMTGGTICMVQKGSVYLLTVYLPIVKQSFSYIVHLDSDIRDNFVVSGRAKSP